MTQTPASAAVVPLDPSTEIDLTNPQAAQVPVQRTQVEYTGTVVLAPDKPVARQYNVVGVLSARDMVELQNAQESGNFLRIIKAIPRMVVAGQRKNLEDFMLSEPESDDEKIELDDVVRFLNDGLEQISARPTAK